MQSVIDSIAWSARSLARKQILWLFSRILSNVKKTKEVIFDLRQKDNVPCNIPIKGQEVERVKEYKYLGVVFDEKLD